jgi:hypothetical protein
MACAEGEGLIVHLILSFPEEVNKTRRKDLFDYLQDLQ